MLKKFPKKNFLFLKGDFFLMFIFSLVWMKTVSVFSEFLNKILLSEKTYIYIFFMLIYHRSEWKSFLYFLNLCRRLAVGLGCLQNFNIFKRERTESTSRVVQWYLYSLLYSQRFLLQWRIFFYLKAFLGLPYSKQTFCHNLPF